jgi:hypothetical protein
MAKRYTIQIIGDESITMHSDTKSTAIKLAESWYADGYSAVVVDNETGEKVYIEIQIATHGAATPHISLFI